MDWKQKAVYKVLKEYPTLKFNQLKRIVVKKEGLMSERPFRQALQELVKEGIVLRIENSRYDVWYTIDFETNKYENDGIKYFEDLFDNYDKIYNEYHDKRAKMTKTEQVEFLINFIKMLHLTRIRFEQFYLDVGKQVKFHSLKVKLVDLIEISEATVYDDGEGMNDEHYNIAKDSDKFLHSEHHKILSDLREILTKYPV